MKKIMFVCTGNICRSPLAEGVLRHLALENRPDIIISSSGIESYHAGEKPDIRILKLTKKHNINMDGIISKQITISDLKNYDYIFGMAKPHTLKLLSVAPEQFRHKIKLLLEFTETPNFSENEIKDPYYGADADFEDTFNLILAAMQDLLQKI